MDAKWDKSPGMPRRNSASAARQEKEEHTKKPEQVHGKERRGVLEGEDRVRGGETMTRSTRLRRVMPTRERPE